jgi:hypothetical protein
MKHSLTCLAVAIFAVAGFSPASLQASNSVFINNGAYGLNPVMRSVPTAWQVEKLASRISFAAGGPGMESQVLVAAAMPPAAPPQHGLARELAGTWNWVSGQTLEIHTDGTLEVFDSNGSKINEARWTVLDAERREVRFVHRSGGWVDTVTLSYDGQSLDGRNNQGYALHGSRRSAPPPPPRNRIAEELAGTWNWVSSQTLEIHTNGTLEVFDGNGNKINEAQWTVLDAERREVRFVHRSGGWVDTVTLSHNGQSLDGRNNQGYALHGTKKRW